LQGARAELQQLGAEFAFIRADVRRDDEVRDLVDQTVARFYITGASIAVDGGKLAR
jgi:NAD(P)-dependent dehydrogenase (short-subunit alcohol dehydrogenase family)